MEIRKARLSKVIIDIEYHSDVHVGPTLLGKLELKKKPYRKPKHRPIENLAGLNNKNI